MLHSIACVLVVVTWLSKGVLMISLPAAEDDIRISASVCDDETKNCLPCASWQDVFSGNCCLVDELQRQACQRYVSEQLLQEDDGDIVVKRTRNSFLGKRPRNTFLGKRNSDEDDVIDDKRARNSFLGKRLAYDELDKRARNVFLGKRSDEFDDEDLLKRARNTFLGKREWDPEVLDKRSRNKFPGKRSWNSFLGSENGTQRYSTKGAGISSLGRGPGTVSWESVRALNLRTVHLKVAITIATRNLCPSSNQEHTATREAGTVFSENEQA